MNDHLSDMVTRIRNGYLAGKREVTLPHTKLNESVAKIMLEEKYLAGVKVQGKAPKPSLVITLLYSGTKPAVTNIKRISKPGIRIYHKTGAIRSVLSGLGITIISSSQGVMTGRTAKQQKLGGEVLVELW